MTPQPLSAAAARRIAVSASLVGGEWQRPAGDGDAILAVVRHFGSLQIDPTRTVEKTHYLVLWSRLGGYDRQALARATYDERRLLEHNAHYVPIERLPELRYEAGPWISRWDGVRDWLAVNRAFRLSILDQLRERGPLPSRQIDDSTLVSGWQSSGWTNDKNTTRMLEFMAKALEVMVSGRVGQERLWDVAERVIPPDAPRETLDDHAYAKRRLEEAMRRFGVADLADIKTRTYWVPKPLLPQTIERFVDEGRLVPVSLPEGRGPRRPAWATPQALAAADSAQPSRTTLVSPFDPLVYDRARTERLFDFSYKLEMYVPRDERQFGHFVLPIVHDGALIGRLDSERDRKTNELIVRKLHWEAGASPAAPVRQAVDEAVAQLGAFVRSG